MRRVILFFVIVLPGTLLGSWLAWFWTPARHVNVLLIDKTVVTPDAAEHKGLTWLMTHDRILPRDDDRSTDDYIGPVPQSDGTFLTRDFTGMSPAQLDSVALANDVAFVADTYGIYEKTWHEAYPFLGPVTGPPKKLYGGLDSLDIVVLRRMAEQNKLLIAEYSVLEPPTPTPVRHEFERLFGIHWTGWSGRQFSSLDSTNDELPQWVVRLYREQNQGAWPFVDQPGIVLTNLDERIVILSYPDHLKAPAPSIVTMYDELDRLKTPRDPLYYPYWFDIVEPDSTMSTLAYFVLPLREESDSLLKSQSIPIAFPAVLEETPALRKYYFAGDFSDYPYANDVFAYFKGTRYLRLHWYTDTDPSSRSEFYWRFYYPLVARLLRLPLPQPPSR